jgi:hypothetical protein
MGYNPIGYVDRESVGIAASALCEKDEIPGTIVRGSGLGSRRQDETGTTNDTRDQALLHDVLSKGVTGLANPQSWRRRVSLGRASACTKRVFFPPTFKHYAMDSMFDWVEHRVREIKPVYTLYDIVYLQIEPLIRWKERK